jgi:hypothetical protein
MCLFLQYLCVYYLSNNLLYLDDHKSNYKKKCPQILVQLAEMSKLLGRISFRLSTKLFLLYLNNNYVNFAILYYFIKI